MKKISVMVVDDSALIRQLLLEVLKQDADFSPIDSAGDPLAALAKMEKSWPDVIISDIEMPKMTGIEFLKKVMAERPTPIIIMSSKTEENLGLAIEALTYGAFELYHKPQFGLKAFFETEAQNLIQSLKAAAHSDVKRAFKLRHKYVPLHKKSETPKSQPLPLQTRATHKLIVIGASTGGTTALEKIISQINFPHCPIVIVQHLAAGFTKAFAERLDKQYYSHVVEAEHQAVLKDNTIYIAPGGLQMRVTRFAGQYSLSVTDDPPVNRHKPSVDALFESVVPYAGQNILGIILTGMGADGASGLNNLYKGGSRTIAQDKASSLIFGMPAKAIELGAVTSILALDGIWLEIQKHCR